MTGTRQHEDGTMLRVQPCRTAAAVGYTIYVRAASPRYAAASCFCQSLSSVTPPYRIFLCAAAAWVCSSSQLIGRLNLGGNKGTFGIVIAVDTNQSLNFSPQRQSLTYIKFYGDFLPTSQMMTRHQTKCGKHDAVSATVPPSSSSSSSSSSRQGHVRVPYPLHTAASFFCHN